MSKKYILNMQILEIGNKGKTTSIFSFTGLNITNDITKALKVAENGVEHLRFWSKPTRQDSVISSESEG